MFCKFCGKEISDNATLCMNCGCETDSQGNERVCRVKVEKVPQKKERQDGTHAGYALLSLFFPIIGLLLCLLWRPGYPLLSKSCLKGTVIGGILQILSVVIVVIVVCVLAFAIPGAAAGTTVVTH